MSQDEANVFRIQVQARYGLCFHEIFILVREKDKQLKYITITIIAEGRVPLGFSES